MHDKFNSCSAVQIHLSDKWHDTSALRKPRQMNICFIIIYGQQDPLSINTNLNSSVQIHKYEPSSALGALIAFPSNTPAP
jgi:hypothetical protein